MTIEKTGNKVQYNGDGGTLAFAYGFRFFDDTDLEVILLDASNVEITKVLTTDYTVSNTGTEDGGTITMIVAPAVGEKLTILGYIPETQPVDYIGNDAFPAETHEAALDRLTRLQQQTSEIASRSLRVTASDTASLEIPFDRASTFLAFDASKNPIALAGSSMEVPVSPFMATVLDDETAAAARATLGAGTGDGILVNVVDDLTPQAGGPFDLNGHIEHQSHGADVASAAALTLGIDGNKFNITAGAAAITSISTLGVGTSVTLHFDVAVTLTNSANLMIAGGVDYPAQIDDVITLYEYATGQFIVSGYALASGGSMVAAAVSPIKAWVNFNGVGTVSINDSFNVSSVTDNGTGAYTINFASALDNSDYAAILQTTGFVSGDLGIIANIKGTTASGATLKSTTNLAIQTGSTKAALLVDAAEISATVIGS